MKNILISGGTGFIGKALISYLLSNYPATTLTVLVRNKRDMQAMPRVRYCLWSVEDNFIDASVPTDIDTVIHLAGANISEKRWTAKRKEVLIKSRTESGKLLVDWVLDKGKAVKTFVSASAIGWYGEGKTGQVFKEEDPAGEGFLAEVCEKWEAAILPLAKREIRLVWIRTGLVMHPSGGMWKALSVPFSLRVAPRFASGKQIFSWVSLADMLAIYAFAASNVSVRGAVNAVSPHPACQKNLVKALLAKKFSSFVVLPIPKILLTTALGELAIELTKNAEVDSKKLVALGFVFSEPNLSDL